ncbi:MAG: TonB-dependent receptor [Flavobacteriales bacterium]
MKLLSLRHFAIIVFFFSLRFSAISQSGIFGFVKDVNSQPIDFAQVIADEGKYGVYTGEDGSYRLELPPGKHSIIARLVGYNDFKLEIECAANEMKELNITLETDARELAYVVISAGKFEQDIGEVTMSMDIIQPKIVQNKNTTSIDEILQQSSGVSIVDNEPQIRSGSGYSFGAGSRVQVLVDDLPMLSGDAGKPSWDFLPVENLSQIEVIKGASSVLYGSSALSGVINMRTAFPGDKPETQVTVFHGMFSNPSADSAKYWAGNLMRTGANFIHKRKIGNLDFVLGGYFLGDDGHLGPVRDTVTGAIDNSYNPFTSDRYGSDTRGRMNMNLRYRFKKINGLSVGLNTNVSMSNSMNTLIWENSTTGLYGAYDGSATRTKQLLSTLDPYITYYGKKGAKHSLRSRWQSLDNNNDNNQGNYSDVVYSEYQYQQDWESWGIPKMTTTIGVVNQTTTSKGELYTGGNENGVNHSLNQAAFFQVDKKVKARLNLSAGVRWEQFVINGVKESKPVFRAGANFKVHKATYFRASYGQGYRFPTIAEKFIVTSLGSINIYERSKSEI